jgi:hypothetical protein
MADVTVVIPLYGEHAARRVLADVCSAWSAEGAAIVVAVDGDAPAGLGRTVTVVAVECGSPAPGLLRNAAAAAATGDWLYLSDADVRPISPGFLDRAARRAGDGAFAQPWMWRLASDQPGLSDEALAWLRERSDRRQCLLRGNGRNGVPAACRGERMEWDGDSLMVVPPTRAAEAELRWRSVFHWGGLLVRRDTFNDVGGYSADYVGWGCEDDDLLVKLRSRVPVTVGWRADTSLRCLHFEHGRPYDTEAWHANQATLARRVAAGAVAMIAADQRAAS